MPGSQSLDRARSATHTSPVGAPASTFLQNSDPPDDTTVCKIQLDMAGAPSLPNVRAADVGLRTGTERGGRLLEGLPNLQHSTRPGGDPDPPEHQHDVSRGTVKVPFRSTTPIAVTLRRTALPTTQHHFNDLHDPEHFHPFARVALEMAPKRPLNNLRRWHIYTDGTHQADSTKDAWALVLLAEDDDGFTPAAAHHVQTIGHISVPAAVPATANASLRRGQLRRDEPP